MRLSTRLLSTAFLLAAITAALADCAPPGAGGCHQASECGSAGTVCYPPAEDLHPAHYGPAPCTSYDLPPCSGDPDCASTVAGGVPGICAPYTCATSRGMTCLPGCRSDADCTAEATVCRTDRRCAYRTCAADPDCPAWFSCTAGACARRGCDDDGDCHGGRCVGTACYASTGHCGGGDA